MARIDEVPGVAESRVDWSGRVFVLRLADGAEPEPVVADASRRLGPGARRLEAREEADALESLRRGDPWLRADETSRLSGREAHVLASGFGGAVAAELSLDPDRAARLVALLEEEFAAAFARIAASPEGLAARMPTET